MSININVYYLLQAIKLCFPRDYICMYNYVLVSKLLVMVKVVSVVVVVVVVRIVMVVMVVVKA